MGSFVYSGGSSLADSALRKSADGNVFYTQQGHCDRHNMQPLLQTKDGMHLQTDSVKSTAQLNIAKHIAVKIESFFKLTLGHHSCISVPPPVASKPRMCTQVQPTLIPFSTIDLLKENLLGLVRSTFLVSGS